VSQATIFASREVSKGSNCSRRDLRSRILHAAQVIRPVKSWTPKTAAKRMRKLHLEVAEGSVKSRQTHRNWSSACSMFVCDSREKIEVRKRNSEESRCKVDRIRIGRTEATRGRMGDLSNRCKNRESSQKLNKRHWQSPFPLYACPRKLSFELFSLFLPFALRHNRSNSTLSPRRVTLRSF